MSEAGKTSVKRREFLKYAATGAVCAVVAGVSGYFAGVATRPAVERPVPPPAKPPEELRFKFANYFPPPSRQSTVLEEFCREVTARTDGRVKFEYYPGGTLLKATEMFDGIITGIADIGYSHVEYTPGRMPVTECLDLPLGYPSAWVGSQVANDFYNKFKPKEFDKVKVLFMNTSNPNLIISRKPVRKLEDLKGLVIRAPGRVGEVIKALGASPAPTPMTEVYEAIAKGVIDGVNSPFETLKTFRFAEVAKYTTVSWQVGNLYTFYVAMNKDSYEKLNLIPGVKEVFDKVCGEYKEKFILTWNMIDFEGKAFAEEQGVELIELPDEEASRWVKAVEPVVESYVKEMVAKGYPEAEVRGWIKFIRDRIEYWTKKQIEYHIPSPTGPKEMRP